MHGYHHEEHSQFGAEANQISMSEKSLAQAMVNGNGYRKLEVAERRSEIPMAGDFKDF